MTATVLGLLALLAAGLVALGASPIGPTPRAAWTLGGCALVALASPPVAIGAAAALTTAFVVDAWMARTRPRVTRTVPRVFARGNGGRLHIDGDADGTLRVRQPVPADVVTEPREADVPLDAELTGLRRGRHELPAVATRVTGPLGLAAWFRSVGGPSEIMVFPDVPMARELALQVRRGRFREAGQRSRGPLGLGTDFESIRDYQWDDDIRQVNWSATVRMGRPMSNQYRVEQDRDVICVVDAGRLMGAPLGGATRLDISLDAVAALCFVADELSDHCGAVAFDSSLIREISPRRKGARTVVRALFDLEPSRSDSDYELAFRAASQAKRSFVVVLTDLLEEAAARPLIEAVPLLAPRHAVLVASPVDTDIEALVSGPVDSVEDAYAAAAAVDVLAARSRAVARLRASGADVVQAPPRLFAAACVESYLRAKQRARL